MEDGEIEEGSIPMAEEDEPAFAHSPEQSKPEESPYEMLLNSKASVENIIAEILSIKKESKPKSHLRDLVTQMFLHFIILRQANRSILLEEDRVKMETERAKAPVDFTTLQLHNLMYEKTHYLKAIKACKDFKSKYPDIDLVPEEEFFRDAPQDIKDSVMSKDSAHNLMLKRLNFELFQRKELCKLHEKLGQQKKALLETIGNRKKFLTSLPSHLKSLKKASLPVQNQLGLMHTKKLKQHQSAELLPPALYVIYSQLLAQKEAFTEPIDVEILGSLKDAQAFARIQAHKDTGISSGNDNSKLEDDVPDEEEDGQRRRKRPRRVQVKESPDQGGIFQVHPLKIIIHVHEDETFDAKHAKLITLRFEYLVKLNVVCVGTEGSDDGTDNDILCNLFPNDTGLELPHQSAKLFVGDAVTFNAQRASRPYKWAQHLAGIDFLPEVSPLLLNDNSEATKSEDVISGLSLYRQQNRVQTILQRIRSRKKAQLALLEQLESLKKLKWPLLSCKSVPWALHTPLCNLDGWSPVRALPVPNEASSMAIIEIEKHTQEPMDVDVIERSGATKEELESLREDGELPTLLPNTSKFDRSKQVSLISKSPPLNKARSQSFKKVDDNSDFLLDTESDFDEPAHIEQEHENISSDYCARKSVSWIDSGVKEFVLVLSRKTNAVERNVNLEAKIKVSMEYPLRPPLFALSLCCIPSGEKHDENDGLEWYNELRAMEAEVNLHILKVLPANEQNYVLAHQVSCLAMLFDYYLDEASPSPERTNCTSVIDVGLCKPVSGRFLGRSLRGRDRRKMISWKDMKFSSPG
ncbi:THO complex subunit 5A [Lotus japonicus]|uniref:THO complex subunit 5A n=1 Tax=Lotus japonicus TaxID=34305 RepID=UPI0025846FBE|nr:THO complex subunit 5A [Lotus japonicus]XP_057428524.1 THO complex subunit 5A [Lotus japonicus]